MDELCPGYTLEVFDFKRVKSGGTGDGTAADGHLRKF
jgi:hypothetical protein